MSPTRALKGVAAILPLLALPSIGARCADALGAWLGRELAVLAPWLAPRPAPPVELLPLATPEPAVQQRDAEPARAPRASRATARGRQRADVVAAGSVHVGAAAVLRLAARGVVPGAEPVPASGRRPAGLALRGVSGLGLGLQDGDVLTHVGGQPVASVAHVVGLVVAERARRAPVISGRVFRGDRVLTLSVEQPYPQKQPAALADARHRG